MIGYLLKGWGVEVELNPLFKKPIVVSMAEKLDPEDN